MQMMLFVGFCLFVSVGYVLGDCNEGCKEPIVLYEDLKCSPLYLNKDDCCPVNYDCSHIIARAEAKEKKCYFHGKTYNHGEAIDDDEVYGECSVGCHCRPDHSGEYGFNCAILDCPEWLGYRPESPGCQLKYELNKCCMTGVNCPPFNVTCEVSGKTYHEGDKFDPPDVKCTECVCQEGFEGKFEPPFCRKRSCIQEVNHQTQILNFCAPTYINLEDCCPSNWICPEDSDKIIPSTNPEKNRPAKCKFGKTELDIGDKFERVKDGGKLSCECRIPPYLTCIRDFKYPAFAS